MRRMVAPWMRVAEQQERENGGVGENVARLGDILKEISADNCPSRCERLVDTSLRRHLAILPRARRILARTTVRRTCRPDSRNNSPQNVLHTGPHHCERHTSRSDAAEEAKARVEPADGVDAPAASLTQNPTATGNSASEMMRVCASPGILTCVADETRTACP